MSPRELGGLMLDLQRDGAANINLVTPTHVAPQIVAAVSLAAEEGLRIPLVWNSGGYDSPQTLRLLDGIVDIYLPDMKYSVEQTARSLSVVPGYPAVNRRAVKEMFRQVGHLQIDDEGRARRGLIVRHLVMPGMPDNTAGVLRWLAKTLGPHTYLSLMDQYRPAFRAFARHGLNRSLRPDEFAQAHALALSLGLKRLDEHLVLGAASLGGEATHD